MTVRYVLIVARGETIPVQRRRNDTSTGLRLIFETDTLLVLADANMGATPLRSRAGALVGDLYDRHGPTEPVPDLDLKTEAALKQTDFRPLLSSYWGGYVGAIRTARGSVIFRDPSATCPCYFVDTDDCIILASDVRTLIAFGGSRPTIDWSGIVDYLYSSGLPSMGTALSGISELLPGTSMRIENGIVSFDRIWSPWHHVSARQTFSDEQNADALRRTIHSCVRALSHRYERPLISVSGGLDSSIVAACLWGTGSSPAGLTMFTDDPSGDERHYSKILCDAYGYELIACRYDLGAIDLDEASSPHLPRPVGRTQGMAYEKALLAHAARRNSDLFLTGNGGDNVLANLRSAKPIVDRYIAEGAGGGLWATARDVADLTGASYWQVIKTAFKAYQARRSGFQWKPNTRFLDPDVISLCAMRPLQHDWLIGPKTALPGQFVHIAGLLRVQQSLEPGRAAFAPVISPLLAQPIVELCLGIPTWQWCAGGRDRAVARMAFNDILPAAILERRVKGTPDGFSAQIIDHHRSEIRERLIGGHLAAHGLLDIPLIETILKQFPFVHGVDRPRLLDLLDTEAWIAHWLGGAGLASETWDTASARSLSQ